MRIPDRTHNERLGSAQKSRTSCSDVAVFIFGKPPPAFYSDCMPVCALEILCVYVPAPRNRHSQRDRCEGFAGNTGGLIARGWAGLSRTLAGVPPD